jgi:hypothetical protein
LIPDGIEYHKAQVDMPAKWADWTYLDFYRNYDWGLPVHIYHTDWIKLYPQGYHHRKIMEGNDRVEIWETPKGDITRIDRMTTDGAFVITKYPVESLYDLAAMQFVVEHTRVEADYDFINDQLDQIGELGVADIVIWRSPFGKCLHEYLGFERTVYWMCDYKDQLLAFRDVQETFDLKLIELAAQSGARVVIISDHADETLVNPRWYQELFIPFYLNATEILHKYGKYISTHLDGNIKKLLPLLKKSGFDIMDGCTPAPMTNYYPEELSAALGEKQFAWCGVPSVLFTQNLPDEKIYANAERIVRSLGKKLILNVGDVLSADGNIDQLIRLGEWSKQQNLYLNTF